MKRTPKALQGTNYEIWLELERLQYGEGKPTPSQKKEARARAKKAAIAEKRQAEAKAREEARRKKGKETAAETAARAWLTYKNAKKAKDAKKAGHWKAYAIRKARQAIEEGQGEALPERLRRAAERQPEPKPAKPRKIYRLYLYNAGTFYLILNRRTREAAEKTKAARTERRGISAEIKTIEEEPEELQRLEDRAIKASQEHADRKRRKHIRLEEATYTKAAELWAAYQAAGGKHPLPKDWRAE